MGNIIETSEDEDGPNIFTKFTGEVTLAVAVLTIVSFVSVVITKEVMQNKFDKSWQTKILILAEGCKK